jgi:hypothetical protein
MKVNMNTFVTATLNETGVAMFFEFIRKESRTLQLPVSDIHDCYNYNRTSKVLTCPLFQMFQIFPTDKVVFVNNYFDIDLTSKNKPAPNSGLHLVKFKDIAVPKIALLSLLPGDSAPVWISDNQYINSEMEWCLKY